METFYTMRDGKMLKVRVIAEIPAKTCARCGARFYLQEGRSQTGQSRTKGVRYCSTRCARAQAQADLRARRRVKDARAIAVGALTQLGR